MNVPTSETTFESSKLRNVATRKGRHRLGISDDSWLAALNGRFAAPVIAAIPDFSGGKATIIASRAMVDAPVSRRTVETKTRHLQRVEAEIIHTLPRKWYVKNLPLGDAPTTEPRLYL
jgi:hypothetical protein